MDSNFGQLDLSGSPDLNNPVEDFPVFKYNNPVN
jgi:hypothetical protein